MKEQWLMPGAVVPVDAETTAALVFEIKRLIGVVGGMALNQKHKWVGLDNDDLVWIYSNSDTMGQAIENTEAKLKEKNHG
jgi:hypothetical protein